ncbi:MAG: hypothetical protein ACRCZ2_11225, partial [Fusobacteriaceae bacterium]
MKKRKLTLVLAILFATGCSNLNMLTEQSKPRPNVEDLRFSPDQSISQNNRVFTRETALSQIDDIRVTVREKREREYILDSRENTYEIYVGEYLKLSTIGVVKFSLLDTEKKLYDSRVLQDYYYFRSIFQGSYNIKVDFENGTTKIIRVINKMKYRFTEGETYDIIKDTYNSGQYKDVLDFVDLHIMAFRESPKNRELDFMVLNIYMNNGNYSYAKEKISELKKERNLSNRDIINLFNAEIALNPNYNIERFYIESSRYNRELEDSIRGHLRGKMTQTSEEKSFVTPKNEITNETTFEKKEIPSEVKFQNTALFQ